MNEQVVIVGAGVIGCCTAFFLAKEGISSVIYEESNQIAPGASGKAGGFLAQDWCNGTPLASLTRSSFFYHTRLAKEWLKDSDYGFRTLDTFAVKVTEPKCDDSDDEAEKKRRKRPLWMNGTEPLIKITSRLGDQSNTAQVNPHLFCEALISETKKLCPTFRVELNKRVVAVSVEPLSMRSDPSIAAVHNRAWKISGIRVLSCSSSTGEEKEKKEEVQEEELFVRSESVVFAMGPWTSSVALWIIRAVETQLTEEKIEAESRKSYIRSLSQSLDLVAGIDGQKAHSVVLQPGKECPDIFPAEAYFVEYSNMEQKVFENPEFYLRPDGTVYICGGSEVNRIPLPLSADLVHPEVQVCDGLLHVASTISEALHTSTVLKKQACYLPTSPDGSPIVGELIVRGAFVAAGHSCWGILNAPATAVALTELIATGKSSTISLEAFSSLRSFDGED